jgi:hypothetical protein
MKKIIEKPLWTIDDPELPNEVKARVLEKHADINTDYNWWHYPDCYFPSFLGNPKITSFDFSYQHYVTYTCGVKLNLMLRLYYRANPKAPRVIHYNRKRDMLFFEANPHMPFDLSFEDTGLRNPTTKIKIYFPDFLPSSDGVTEPTTEELLGCLRYNNDDKAGIRLAEMAESLWRLFHWIDTQIDPLKELESDYDFLTSEEAIIETLATNGYFFDETGKIC